MAATTDELESPCLSQTRSIHRSIVALAYLNNLAYADGGKPRCGEKMWAVAMLAIQSALDGRKPRRGDAKPSRDTTDH